ERLWSTPGWDARTMPILKVRAFLAAARLDDALACARVAGPLGPDRDRIGMWLHCVTLQANLRAGLPDALALAQAWLDTPRSADAARLGPGLRRTWARTIADELRRDPR